MTLKIVLKIYPKSRKIVSKIVQNRILLEVISATAFSTDFGPICDRFGNHVRTPNRPQIEQKSIPKWMQSLIASWRRFLVDLGPFWPRSGGPFGSVLGDFLPSFLHAVFKVKKNIFRGKNV